MKLLYKVIIIALVLCALSYVVYLQNKEHFTFVSIPNTHISPITDTKTDFVFYPKGLKGAVPVGYGYHGDYLDEMYVLHKTTKPERLENSIIGQSEIPHNKCNQQTFYEF